jgi:hypothetical protein
MNGTYEHCGRLEKYQILKHASEAYRYDVIGQCGVSWKNHGEIDGEIIW